MRIIVRIARLEINKLFYSPIAWVVLIVFAVQVGVSFVDIIEELEGRVQRGLLLRDITFKVFSNRYDQVFQVVKRNIFLYIPLLSMGIISSELNSGSIKLLFSSPMTIRQIVLGKYLALVGYIFVLMGLLGIVCLAGSYAIASIDFGLLLSGLLGIFLILCAYAAIGLFISSLSSYQVVTAIITFVLIAILNAIGKIWQDIPVVNEINYWLSLPERAEQMIGGLISSAGVSYFLLIISLFLALTVFKLSFKKNHRSWPVKVGFYSALLMIVILAGYLTSKPRLTVYHDSSGTKRNTIVEESRQVTTMLKGKPVKITSYVNILSDLTLTSGLPKYHNRNFRELEEYTRFLPQLEMTYVYFYDSIPGKPKPFQDNPGLSMEEIARKYANSFGMDFDEILHPEEIRKIVDLRPENNEYVRLIRSGDKTSFLRLFYDTSHYPTEMLTSATLKHLTHGATKLKLIKGHGERTLGKKDHEHSHLNAAAGDRNSLRNLGYTTSSVFIDDPGLMEPNTVLVLSDPKEPFTQAESKIVLEYLDQGGNMLIMCDPENRQNVEFLADELGIGFLPGKLKQENKDISWDYIIGSLSDDAYTMDSPFLPIRRPNNQHGPKIAFPGAMGLTVRDDSKFKIFPIVNTFGKTVMLQDSVEITATAEIPLILALQREVRGKNQLIIIAGDADFLSNREYARQMSILRTYNKFVVPLFFRWLSNDQYPINTKDRDYPNGDDDKILLNASGIQITRGLLVFILPGLIFVFGAVLLIKRRRN